jgi:hypothetical protein
MKSNQKKVRPVLFIFWAIAMIVLLITTTNDNQNQNLEYK